MTPLIELALAYIAGNVAGLRIAGGAAALLALVVAASLLFPVAGRPLSRRKALLAFTLLGIAGGAGAGRSAARDCRTAIPDGASITATGLLEPGAQAGARALLRVEEIHVAGRRSGCAEPLRIRLPDRLAAGLAGTDVRVVGNWWRSDAEGGWPRPGDRGGTLSVRTITRAAVRHRHPGAAMRSMAVRQVRKRFEKQTALAESLLLARRESLDAAVREDFAAAGLAHLLAISGAHVGILTAMVVLVAGLAGFRPRVAATAGTAAALVYVVFLGAPAAAARAAIQGVALLASRLGQRPADRLTLIAGAALALIAADPLAPLNAGFQLSFAGVFGLVAFGPPVSKSLPAAWPRALVSSLAPTLAATAATAPIAAWHFGLVSFIGPLSNVAAAPVLACSIPAMALALLLGPIATPIADFLAGGAEALLALLRAIARLAAALPGSHAAVTPGAVTAAVVAVAVFLVCGPASRAGIPSRSGRERRTSRVRYAARAGAAAALLIAWPVLRPGGGLEIHVVDVGQGDAIAIHTPAGHWIVVDTGPAGPTFDAGRQRVVPYLLARGAHRVDLLVLTHPDMDHIGGARALMSALPVRSVMDPVFATGKGLYFETLDAARRAGGAWLAAEAGREIESGSVVIRVLAPDSALLDGLHEANDLSVVLRLEYGEFSALLTGDAPQAVENRLVARHGAALESDLLKVGHHGSRTSTGDSLLRAARPSLAIISVGRRNRYGHPAPAVLDRLARYGVRVARTDESGSLIVRVRPDGSMRLLSTRRR